jgi:hypothetical protein
LVLLLWLAPAAAPPTSGEAAGVAYLVRHVPMWQRKNRCFSCHHNGDAARALFASGRNDPVTLRWLQRPEGWEKNGGDGEFNDRKLARLQFTVALVEADRAGLLKGRRPLVKAAAQLAGDQRKDGRWSVVAPGTDGGPTVWGDALATALALSALRRADAKKHRAAVERAGAWLRRLKVVSVMDAAAVLIGLGKAEDEAARAQRRRCLALIEKAQSRAGGWGPYATSPPEVFDTALVLVALAGQGKCGAMRARGRAWLLAQQETDGSWPETTRPGGAVSYAQRLSTAAWAVLALRAR